MAVMAIDTAGPEIGVALLANGTVKEWSGRVKRGSESALGKAVAELLEGGSLLEGIVVSVGPGAFTSLRVGVATASGLALASNCQVLPVCSLRARALGRPGRVLSLLDGRKNRAYAALFEDGVPVGEAVDWEPERAIALAKGASFLAVGEGALVWRERVLQAGGQVAVEASRSPVAEMTALFERHPDEVVPPEGIRLRYLRAPDAQLPKDAPS